MIDKASEFLKSVARRQAITIRRLDRLEKALQEADPAVLEEPLEEPKKTPWWKKWRKRG